MGDVRPLRSPRPPGRSSRSNPAASSGPLELLTVDDVCAELRINRSTFYGWRQAGVAPPVIRLPNGSLRVRRAQLNAWLATHEENAA